MFSLLYGLFEYLFRKVEFRVLILGIDRSGKTTLLEKIKSLYTEYEGLPPDKIQPTVGLNIGRAEALGAKLVFWDLGGQVGLRTIWEKYYGEAHAVVFVVDAADAPRVEEAKSAFVKASGAKDLKGAPILVLANKHDTLLQMGTGENSGPGGPGPVGLHGVSAELQKTLGLAKANLPSRPVRAFACSALHGDGVKDGVVWLVDAMRKSQRSRDLDDASMHE